MNITTEILKFRGRRLYYHLEGQYDRYDCGRSLARYIDPSLATKEKRLASIIEELKRRELPVTRQNR